MSLALVADDVEQVLDGEWDDLTPPVKGEVKIEPTMETSGSAVPYC